MAVQRMAGSPAANFEKTSHASRSSAQRGACQHLSRGAGLSNAELSSRAIATARDVTTARRVAGPRQALRARADRLRVS
jgi:hypothetical protein